MFFNFRQNNSGGFFRFPAVNVIIEADNAVEANTIAGDNQIYFNGVVDGTDCWCCGDRWYAVRDDDWDASPTPTIYGEPAETYTSRFAHRDDVQSVRIYFKDGKVQDYA